MEGTSARTIGSMELHAIKARVDRVAGGLPELVHDAWDLMSLQRAGDWVLRRLQQQRKSFT